MRLGSSSPLLHFRQSNAVRHDRVDLLALSTLSFGSSLALRENGMYKDNFTTGDRWRVAGMTGPASTASAARRPPQTCRRKKREPAAIRHTLPKRPQDRRVVVWPPDRGNRDTRSLLETRKCDHSIPAVQNAGRHQTHAVSGRYQGQRRRKLFYLLPDTGAKAALSLAKL